MTQRAERRANGARSGPVRANGACAGRRAYDASAFASEAAIREDAPLVERPLFHTEGGGIAADVVKVNTRRNVATYTDEFEAVTPSQAETKLKQRIYDPKTKAFENYLDHIPNRITAEWIPRRIEVWFQGQKTEQRTLVSVDEQGRASYRVQSLGLVPSFLLELAPIAIRPVLPSALRVTSGTTIEQVDTREPDGVLYCRHIRGAGEINERTYYDVDRERELFAATGQNIEIPLRTFHVLDGEPVSPEPTSRRPCVYYTVVYESLVPGVIDRLASYAVNAESTYGAGDHAQADDVAPQPEEVHSIVAKQGLQAPIGRRFRWERRLHLRGWLDSTINGWRQFPNCQKSNSRLNRR